MMHQMLVPEPAHPVPGAVEPVVAKLDAEEKRGPAPPMLERRVDQTILPDPDERQQCNTAEQAIEELVAQRAHQGGQRLAPIIELPRSEERRVGKECVSAGKSRGATSPK